MFGMYGWMKNPAFASVTQPTVHPNHLLWPLLRLVGRPAFRCPAENVEIRIWNPERVEGLGNRERGFRVWKGG